MGRDYLGVAIFMTGVLIISLFAGAWEAERSDNRLLELNQFKREAFERGHMVQCLGRTGFYWECD